MNVFRLLPVSLALSLAITFSFAQQNKKMNDKLPQTPLAESRQLVLVITPDWNAVDGKLWRYERHSAKDAWQQIESGIPVVVGKNGLAWGSGLHAPQHGSGPVKKEGDGKSPAGIFRLSSAFGYASAAEAGAIKLPYTHLTGTIECVDDVKSEHYNTILDRNSASVDWNSSEKMREQKDYYRWGVVVDHNAAPVRKGGGSCIFLHIWNHAGSGTAGCTAMEGRKMEALMRWLDPAAKPLLVQLTEAEYQRLSKSWQLPQRR
ncbi:MAG: L,D-transpeptidase family protein [Blastocatellia bacterium]